MRRIDARRKERPGPYGSSFPILCRRSTAVEPGDGSFDDRPTCKRHKTFASAWRRSRPLPRKMHAVRPASVRRWSASKLALVNRIKSTWIRFSFAPSRSSCARRANISMVAWPGRRAAAAECHGRVAPRFGQAAAHSWGYQRDRDLTLSKRGQPHQMALAAKSPPQATLREEEAQASGNLAMRCERLARNLNIKHRWAFPQKITVVDAMLASVPHGGSSAASVSLNASTV
jgi:hypothetical protein